MCALDQRPDPTSFGTDPSRPIAVIKTGRTYPELAKRSGDFEDWIVRGLGTSPPHVQIVDVEHGHPLPQPEGIAGAVVTGSHSMVTDGQRWVEPLAEWLRWLVEEEVPFLGVCYGHQLLGHAFGGRVGFHPEGPEIGTVEVSRLADGTGDLLLGGLPKRFPAHSTHAQSVLILPEEAVLLARTDHEAHAAFRVGPCAWGVQFHPEYDQEIMLHYVAEQWSTLEALDRDPAQVEREVQRAGAEGILSRFAELSLPHHPKEPAG